MADAVIVNNVLVPNTDMFAFSPAMNTSGLNPISTETCPTTSTTGGTSPCGCTDTVIVTKCITISCADILGFHLHQAKQAFGETNTLDGLLNWLESKHEPISDLAHAALRMFVSIDDVDLCHANSIFFKNTGKHVGPIVDYYPADPVLGSFVIPYNQYDSPYNSLLPSDTSRQHLEYIIGQVAENLRAYLIANEQSTILSIAIVDCDDRVVYCQDYDPIYGMVPGMDDPDLYASLATVAVNPEVYFGRHTRPIFSKAVMDELNDQSKPIKGVIIFVSHESALKTLSGLDNEYASSLTAPLPYMPLNEFYVRLQYTSYVSILNTNAATPPLLLN